MKKPKGPTKAQLKHKVKELEAQLASTYHFSSIGVEKCSRDHLMGSGVLVELTFLGGKQVCPPFVLRDGMSADTIACLQADMRASYERSMELKPK